MADEDDIEGLVAAAAAGDEHAWQRLWAATEVVLLRIVAQPRFLGRMSQREDDRRNIVVTVMGRLRAEQFHRLRMYLDARRTNPQLRFMQWLRVVTKRVGIDYLRGHPDFVRRHEADASSPGHWVDPATLPPASQLAGERPPVTNRGTAREVLLYAATSLPEAQRRAIELWAHSESFEQIAAQLALGDAGQAERMVRAALERLRRRFREVPA